MITPKTTQNYFHTLVKLSRNLYASAAEIKKVGLFMTAGAYDDIVIISRMKRNLFKRSLLKTVCLPAILWLLRVTRCGVEEEPVRTRSLSRPDLSSVNVTNAGSRVA